MKTKKLNNELTFKKSSLVELNDESLKTINGGTGTTKAVNLGGQLQNEYTTDITRTISFVPIDVDHHLK